jgi:pimeloyl-ACP methyl ester carboxylesterase
MNTSTHNIISETISMPDGRKLGISHYGDLKGKPLLFFPGFGVSRLAAHPDQTIASSHGIHVISVDRPGIGLSDPQPGRSLLDWPNDITFLADKLCISKFAILGWSAGGAFALACAYKIPERLIAIGVISSSPPFSDKTVKSYLPIKPRLLATISRISPWLIHQSFKGMRKRILNNPKKAMDKSIDEMVEADRKIATDPRYHDILLESMVTACRMHYKGLSDDVLTVARPWGFSLQQIIPLVYLWHGESDIEVPVKVGHYLADQIPNCCPKFYAGEGHFMYLSHWEEILKNLFPNKHA